MKIRELNIVIEEAKKITQAIIGKYSLNCYPVFSSLQGQCELTAEPGQIMIEFPDMVHDSDDKDRAAFLTGIILIFEAEKKRLNVKNISNDVLAKDLREAVAKLNRSADKLEIKEDTYVELRFVKPKLEEVFRLQQDPLISQLHTPQSRASVCIALGTIGELYQSGIKKCEVL